MSTILDLSAPFEGTATAAVVVGGNVDAIFGAAPVYSSTKVVGNTSVEYNQSANNSTLVFDIDTPRAEVYYDFYLQMVTIPNSTFPLVSWSGLVNSVITKGGDLRVVGNGTTFNLQLRKSPANTTLYTSTWNLAAGQYRIQLKLLPNGGAAGYSVKVYSGAGINSDTPVNNSGDLDATSSGITSISRMQIGLIVNPAALTVLRVDDIIADDSTAVSRAAAATTGRFYKQDGVWVPYDNLYRSAGAWVQ